jgi:hypothetical protein
MLRKNTIASVKTKQSMTLTNENLVPIYFIPKLNEEMQNG